MDFNFGKIIRSSQSLSFSSPNPDLSSPVHLFSASFSPVPWATQTLFLLPQDKESMMQERERVCDSG